MNISQLVNKEKIKKTYIFHHVDKKNENEIYFCNCGEIIQNKTENTSSIQIRNAYKDINFEKIFDDAKTIIDVICPNCKKFYMKENIYCLIFPTNDYFLETFKFVETKTKLVLYKIRISPVYKNNMKNYSLESKTSYISLNKKSKKLTYFNEENKEKYCFSLDKIIETTNKFFRRENEKISDNLIEIHSFINRLANFVSDSKNFNLIDELLKEMIGKSGLNILSKTISIFFAIITYPNFSTIALTKGLNFLYDMLNSCKLPDPSSLSENNVTSPLKIFNFLVNLENKNIQDELDTHNPEKQGYIYKSKQGKIHKFLYDANRFEKNIEEKIHIGKEGINVRDDLTNKSVSKYIFKNIKTFNDYKKIIKYTKFIKYEELIYLVMKYDIELLINLFPIIEFRDDVTIERLTQFINLAKNYAKRVQIGFSKNIGNANNIINRFLRNDFTSEEENKIEIENIDEKIKDNEVKYSLIKTFDFTIYDDSLRMINSLGWDVNKEFYKIKKINELEDYHNQLTKYFNMLSDREKNEAFKNFVFKFKYLEDYNGNLKIKLIPTADELLKEAKKLNNCAGSYVNRISKGQYVMFMVRDVSNDDDKEKDEFMLGFHATKTGLEFDQVKSKCNRQGSNKFKKQIMTYLEEKDISYRELADLKLKDEAKITENDFDLFGKF